MRRQITAGMARASLGGSATPPQEPRQQLQAHTFTPAPLSSPPQNFSPPPQALSPPPQAFSPSPQAFSPPPPAQPSTPSHGGMSRISYMSPQALPKPASSSGSFSLAHPSSSNWTNTSDLLPPPPPAPILRSGGIPTQAKPVAPQPDTPRRMTRSQAKPPIGDSERNPYAAKSRREGGGVV